MIPARDSLRAIQNAAAADFDGTRLAGDLSTVVRPVRRHRAVRATVGTAAGVVAIGAVALWNQQQRPETAGIAGQTPSPSVTAPASPAPTTSAAPSPHAEAPVATMEELVTVGERIDRTVESIAAAYGTPEEQVRAAIIAALPAEAGGEPEGWVSPSDLPAPARMEDAAALAVNAQLQNLNAMGVAPENWAATLTIASILVQESPDPYAWADISQVIHNRLDAGLRLEIASPLSYITRADERTVTDDGFAVDSPYNTFMYEGLPPGPIGASNLSAVDTAANPTRGDLLYFEVHPETGETLFATTFHEHQVNLVELGLLDQRDVLTD